MRSFDQYENSSIYDTKYNILQSSNHNKLDNQNKLNQVDCYIISKESLAISNPLLSIINKMARVVPWRNKPTQLINEMIPVAKELKLYLVHEIGPTSMVLKDENNNKFKVVIGDTVNCSCAVVKNDHCIHSLFVMLKKFKVSQTHPILWQASYLDSQLDGLTQHKYQQNSKPKTKISAKQFLKRKKQQKKEQEDDFPPLDEEEVCPICYEEMNGQCYSSCDTCHKCFHTKCFKVWTKHKEDSKNPVTCPMCRKVFNNPTKIIFRDLERWQQRFSTHKGTQCKGCGQKNIKGLIYKCLTCPNTDVCKLCYEGNQHLDHELFCVKELSTDKWKLAPVRVKKTRKQLFQPIEEIDTRELPQLESPEFVLHLLPTLREFNAKQAKSELGIVGNILMTRTMCTKCHTAGNQDMIRLACSHPIHAQCLTSMVLNKEYCCEIDNEVICPGYWAALGIKVTKPVKKSTTDVKFMRNNEQIQLLEKKNALNQVFEPFSTVKEIKEPRNMSLGIGKETITGVNRISGVKLKQTKPMRPPSLAKKSALERKTQIDSLSIGGFGMKFGGGNLGLDILSGHGLQNMTGNMTRGQQNSSNNIMWGTANKIPPKHRAPNQRNNTSLQR